MAGGETRTITYRGGAFAVPLLVKMLRDEGVRVESPQERRDLASMAQDYVVELLATGTIAAMKLAVDKFRQRAGGQGTAKIEDEDD